nr:ribonuclease H-like domain-containing protein [Tanacetum cinerariifolium]
MIQETTKMIILIKQRTQATQDRQKSYADLKRKSMEFEVGERVMLKVLHWKGVIRFDGNGPISFTIDTNGMIKVLPPKIAEEVVAKERERKARTTLLMALPKDQFAKFHKMADVKEMFQTLLSQLEIHGASVSHEDANQKFLRSLPSSWSQVALIMRTNLGLDTLSFDDLYNNLRVFDRDVKDYDDLEHLNDDDIEEMDLKWQVAMISMRIQKFHKRTGRKLRFHTKDPVGFDKTKVECFNSHKMGHFGRDCRAKWNQDSRRRDVGYNGNKARDNGRRPTYEDYSKLWLPLMERILTCLDILLNTQMSANDKFGLRYGDSIYGSIWSDENKVLQSVFMNKTSDLEDTPVNDRFSDGMHAVPSPIKGNYMPSGPDVEIDYSKFTYGPKQTSADESDSKPINAARQNYSRKAASTSTASKVNNARPFVNETRLKRHMKGNKAYLDDYQEFKGGSVAFKGSNGRIIGKGKIKAGKLDFEDVYYVEELKHYNPFFVSQMCYKKNKVLFTDTDCLVLSLDFKLLDEN